MLVVARITKVAVAGALPPQAWAIIWMWKIHMLELALVPEEAPVVGVKVCAHEVLVPASVASQAAARVPEVNARNLIQSTARPRSVATGTPRPRRERRSRGGGSCACLRGSWCSAACCYYSS